MRVQLKPLVALMLAVATAAGVVAAVIETPSSAPEAELIIQPVVDDGWVLSSEKSDSGYLWSSRHGELGNPGAMVAPSPPDASASILTEWPE